MIELTLPWPPSVNAMWRTPNKGPLAGRTMLSEEGRAYRLAVRDAVLLQGRPRIGEQRCAVDIEMRMPDRRRRDVDNAIKGPLDALTHASVWVDDSQVDDLRVWRSARGGGCIVVRITPIPSAQLELSA